eukprot:TRINITY_DN1412_c0_g1_i2.p1 TRINITY_DN1412_c0_g1~~TRINITY_DN1412_c0_g1_i2.p1  ORF type:complete len:443 (+),score=96.52 TRINITY_DN1412_c0_g1_i2:116-1444(+)
MDLASLFMLVSKLYREKEYQKTYQLAHFALEYMESNGVQDEVIKGQLLSICCDTADQVGKFTESIKFALQVIDRVKTKQSSLNLLSASIDHIYTVIVKNRWFTQENVDLFMKIFRDIVKEPRTSREVIRMVEHEIENYTFLKEYEQALNFLSQLCAALSIDPYPNDEKLSSLCERNQQAFKQRSEMPTEPSSSSMSVITDDSVRNYENASNDQKGEKLLECPSAFIMKRVDEIELEPSHYSVTAYSSREYLLGVMTLANRFYSAEDWKQALRYSKKCFDYIKDRKTLYLENNTNFESVKAHCAVLITNCSWFLGNLTLCRTFLLQALVYFMSHRNEEYSRRMLYPSFDQFLLLVKKPSTPQDINHDLGMCESFLKELIDNRVTSHETIDLMNKTLTTLKSCQSSCPQALELLITVCQRLSISPYPADFELVALLKGINALKC